MVTEGDDRTYEDMMHLIHAMEAAVEQQEQQEQRGLELGAASQEDMDGVGGAQMNKRARFVGGV